MVDVTQEDAVAAKAELTHEIGEQQVEALARAGEPPQARGDVVGEVVELLERGVEVEGRVLLAADQQRGLAEVEGGVGGCGQLGEAGAGKVGLGIHGLRGPR